MAKEILIKPIISEKSEKLSEKLTQYSFIVNKSVNKIEIRKAVEDQYGVTVSRVNTLIMPKKARSRNTKSGVLKGHLSSFKKAIVTLEEGETIDLYDQL